MPKQIPDVDIEFKKFFIEQGSSSTFKEKDSRPFMDLKSKDLDFNISSCYTLMRYFPKEN